jgi:hypothetical protein
MPWDGIKNAIARMSCNNPVMADEDVVVVVDVIVDFSSSDVGVTEKSGSNNEYLIR